MWSTPLSRVRAVALAEGVSFLLLLGVAMPLKYLADMPLAVKVVGWLHGALFVLLCALVADATRRLGWPARKPLTILIAALLPFGPFVLDPRLARDAEASSAGPNRPRAG